MTDVNVVQALSKVMEDVREVGKSGRNTQQGYAFRGVDAVVNAVGPALRAHGVVVVPVAESVEYETYTTKSGTVMRSCVVRVRFVFHGPAGDTLESVVYGESSDAGDKSTPKAHSVAFRTALLQALCIPTDEADPDESSHERVSQPKASGGPVCALCGESLAGSAVAIVEGKKTHRDGCPTGEAA